MNESEILQVKQKVLKYETPIAIPLTGKSSDEKECISGAGDIGCGTGSCAVYDCSSNGAGAQVARPNIREKVN